MSLREAGDRLAYGLAAVVILCLLAPLVLVAVACFALFIRALLTTSW